MTVELIKLDDIRTDGGTQQRVALNDATVAEYAEAVESGAVFPPVTVFRDDNSNNWLAAGFHRHGGYVLAGKTEIPAEIRQGSLRDAILFACGDNADHGLRRSNEDKRKAVTTLLQDEEWGQRSTAWLSDAAKVSRPFIEKIREEQHATLHVDDPKPQKRIGKDGKARTVPAKKQPTQEETDQARQEMMEDMEVEESSITEDDVAAAQEQSGVLLDSLGLVVPDVQKDAWAALPQFKEVIKTMNLLRKQVDELARTSGGEFLAGVMRRVRKGTNADNEHHFRHDYLEDFLFMLRANQPYASVCPYCHHEGQIKKTCKVCYGLDRVIKQSWDAAPRDYTRRAMEDRRES